jgi:hypothetical protein
VALERFELLRRAAHPSAALQCSIGLRLGKSELAMTRFLNFYDLSVVCRTSVAS